MTTPAFTVELAPTNPISMVVQDTTPGMVVVGNNPQLGIANTNPAQLMMATGGSAGAVTSVNAQTGAVLVLGPIINNLVDGPTITPSLATAGHFRVTLQGNRTFANPTFAVVDGQRWVLEVHQDSVGGRTISWGSQYHFGATLGVPVLSTAANKYDYIAFFYNLPNGTHDCVGFVAGY